MSSSPRRRLALIGAALALLALLVFLFTRQQDRKAAPTPAVQAAVVTPPSVPPPPPPLAPRNPGEPLEAALPAAEAPIIDEIILEKGQVCAGEENLVTVRAHTPGNKDDRYLHYMVVADTGASVPVRLEANEDESAGTARKIIVFGRDGTATSAELPSYPIMDCKPQRKLILARALRANTEGTFTFTARITNVLATAPMDAPVVYNWEFGDGTTAQTEVPTVEHDYSGRPQETLYSQLLVSCEAIASDGEILLGRTSLELMNVAFEEVSKKGAVKLMVELTPRFPVISGDGVVEQQARIWHHRAGMVTVKRITVTRNSRSEKIKPHTEEVDVEATIGTRLIPPGGIITRVFLDTKNDADLYSIDYTLEGVSEEGWMAHGNFSVMRPPDRPTRETSQPVMDAFLKAKIVRARELLHQEFVTDEDLDRLDREGRFDDLKAQAWPAPEPDVEDPTHVKPPPR